MRATRIFLILTEFPPSVGGMQTHALYLSQHLACAGYEIKVVTYRASNPQEERVMQAHDAELPFPVHRSLSRLSFWHNIDILARQAAAFQPDLVYASTVFYGFVRDRLNVPVVCRSVGNDVLRPWIAYPFRPGSRLLGLPGLDNWVYSTFKRFEYPDWVYALFYRQRMDLVGRSARRMDAIFANSEFTAGLFDELGVDGERVRVLVGGVDAARFAPPRERDLEMRRALGIDENAYVITTVCRLVAKKGVDFLLRALPALRELIPNVHLLVVGDGKHGKRYQRLAQELGLADRVTFAGQVNHLEVQRCYWLSDLFVLASREDVEPVTGQRDAETMGRVLCEANAAGVPVIAARSGGIPSVIKHLQNGLLFDPEDEADLLRQVARIRADRTLTQEMVQSGLHLARATFDWPVVVQAHERAFAHILAERRQAQARPCYSTRISGR